MTRSFHSRTRLFAFLVLLAVLATSPISRSQQADPETFTLDSLKLEYDVHRAELLKPVQELNAFYEEKLNGLLDRVTEAGELTKALAVKAELENFKKPKDDAKAEKEEAPTFSELDRLQEIFVAERADRIETANEKLDPLMEAYQAKLLVLQKRLTREKKLEEAVEVQSVLKEVEAHLSEGETSLTSIGDKGEDDDKKNLLQGKTISYPHPRETDFTVNVEFHRDGKATYVGLGYLEVPWVYEMGESPLIYYFWSPHQRTKETGMIIKLAPDGRTGKVSQTNGSQKADAIVGRARR